MIKKPVAQQSAVNPAHLKRSTPQVRHQEIPHPPVAVATPSQPAAKQQQQPVVAKRIASVATVRDRINRTRREVAPVPRRREPPKVTQLSTDLTPEQKERVKQLQGIAQGQYLVILGNGPSLANIDTHILSQYPTVRLCTINVPDERCWPTPYWAFYDRSQYHRHKELYKTFQGTIFNSTGIKEPNHNSIKFKHIPGLGYSRDITRGVYVGMSSVFATLQIAMYMMFNRIYVIGCDMNEDVDSTQTHFYGVNPDVNPDERKKRFKKEANWYDRMTEMLTPEEKAKIVFCTKGVNKWPFMDHFQTVTPLEATNFIIQDTGNAR